MSRITIALLSVLTAVVPAASQIKKPRPKAPARTPKKPVAAPAKKPFVGPPMKAAPAPAPARTLRGPLDLLWLQQERRAAVTHSRLIAGELEALQDANRYTSVDLASEAGAPAWLQVVLDRPLALEQVDLTFAGEGEYEWRLEAAATLADLKSRKGGYRRLVGPRIARSHDADQALLIKAPAFRIYRLEARSTEPGVPVRLSECALWAPQQLARMRIESFSPEMAVHGSLPLKVHG
ncbi:MAG: hypothetical protein ACO1SX_19635, partial [Actinomycetota bacterium]